MSASNSHAGPSTIPIHVTANAKGLVWSVDDVRTLRVKHNICGSLQGTLPGITQQNIFLGLPLSLMPEEVVLLVDNGKYTLESFLLIEGVAEGSTS